MPIPRGAPEPTVCLRQLFQSVTISRQQQLTDKESFKHGRAIGSQDSRDSFTHNEKHIINAVNVCFEIIMTDCEQKTSPDVLL